MLCVVNWMCSHFNIQPEMSYIQDVILPSFNCEKNPTLAFENLKATHINPQTCLFAKICERLRNGDFNSAYKFATTNKGFYAINVLKERLINAFAGTGDVKNFVAFVRLICESYPSINSFHEKHKKSVAKAPSEQIEFASGILLLAICKRRNDMELITELLNAFVNEGISINPNCAEKIENLYDDIDP